MNRGRSAEYFVSLVHELRRLPRETEWVETLSGDWNRLVNEPSELVASATRERPSADRGEPYGDGRAALHVIETLLTFHNARRSS